MFLYNVILNPSRDTKRIRSVYFFLSAFLCVRSGLLVLCLRIFILFSKDNMLVELLFLGLSFVAASAQRDDAEGKHWALVVAGSSTWGNYRHQVLYSLLFLLTRRKYALQYITLA